MKVTSFRDVETYLYSSVILPLKGMNVRPLDFPSPISSIDGKRVWELRVMPEPQHRVFRRNYQNTQARRNANQQVVLWTGTAEYVIATYQPRNHWVKVYERPFKTLKATPLMGKLYEVFSKNTPFTKIISELDPPVQGIMRDRRGRAIDMEAPEAPYDDDTEGYEEEDY